MKKFAIGDIVRIAKDLGPSMSHFTSDADAVVMGTYGTEYGSGKVEINDSYGLYIRDEGYCAWYSPQQLTKIGRLPRIKGKRFPTELDIEEAAEKYFRGNK